jgi:hypothetical protein
MSTETETRRRRQRRVQLTRAGGEPLAVELSSVAAAMAARQVAARTRASRSSIVLAAVCAVVAHRASYPELVFPLLSSNRFERRMTNYVGTLAQITIATIKIGGRTFDELVRHTWTTVMEASRHSRHDAAKRLVMDELIEHERGLRLNYAPLFNNLIPESWSGLSRGVGLQPGEIDAALARTELRWRPMPANSMGEEMPIWFRLNQVDGCVRLDVWSGDAGHPLAACLTATDTIRTPEQAHAGCMTALARHPTAVTPRYYLISRTAPPDLTDPAAWPPPLATGTGRTLTH